ncbi:MAG: hypothetical protein AB1700_06645 [Bacillota bacterium]
MKEVLRKTPGEIKGMKSDIGDLEGGQARVESRLDEIFDKNRVLFHAFEDAFRSREKRLDRCKPSRDGARQLPAEIS